MFGKEERSIKNTMSDINYPLDDMTDTASTVQKQVTDGQIYKTYLSNLLSEMSNLPPDIAQNIIPAWRNWHLAVHSHFQSYSLLGQVTQNGSLAMEEQDQTNAKGFDI
jgi:uncharacterized protein YukE